MGYVATAAGAGGVTQLLNWKFSRKKAAAEIKSDEIDNIKKTVEVYQTIISDQNKRINELTAEVQELRDERRRMEQTYQKQIADLQKQIVEITKVLGIQSNRRIRDERTGRYVPKKDGK